jgi:hypothetical protein
MKFEGTTVLFESTGRIEYTYGNQFSPNGEYGIFYGSDGGIPELINNPLTDEERKEIYDYMINEWNKWLRKE